MAHSLGSLYIRSYIIQYIVSDSIATKENGYVSRRHQKIITQHKTAETRCFRTIHYVWDPRTEFDGTGNGVMSLSFLISPSWQDSFAKDLYRVGVARQQPGSDAGCPECHVDLPQSPSLTL